MTTNSLSERDLSPYIHVPRIQRNKTACSVRKYIISRGIKPCLICKFCRAKKTRCDANRFAGICTNCRTRSKECDYIQQYCPAVDDETQPKTLHSSSKFLPPEGHSETSGVGNLSNSADSAEIQVVADDRVSYHGESFLPNMMVRIRDQVGETEIHHYPISLLEAANQKTASATVTNNAAMALLKRRSALIIPATDIVEHLLELYFENVHPQLPIVNKSDYFTSQETIDIPRQHSILLTQVMLLAACRYSKHPSLLSSEDGTTHSACVTFWKRARAILETDFEKSQLVLVQANLLLAWCPGIGSDREVITPLWHYAGTAIRMAQSLGMHTRPQHPLLSFAKEKLWKRVWAVCIVIDRFLFRYLGYPSSIDTQTSDPLELTLVDFDEAPSGSTERTTRTSTHSNYFIALYNLVCIDFSRRDAAGVPWRSLEHAPLRRTVDSTAQIMKDLERWRLALPDEFVHDIGSTSNWYQDFWVTVLHINYYSIVLRVYRFQYSYDMLPSENSLQTAIRTAHMITTKLQSLLTTCELYKLPANLVYSLFLAMLFQISYLDRTDAKLSMLARKDLALGFQIFNHLNPNWLVAKLVHTLLLKIVESVALSERVRVALWGLRLSSETASQNEVVSDDLRGPTPNSLNVIEWYDFLGVPLPSDSQSI